MIEIDKVLWMEPGKGIGASGRIPESLECFQDHFPEYPVLPGVLALEILKKTAECYVRQFQRTEKGTCSFLKEIRAVKFSHYLRPGDEWESRVEMKVGSDGAARWRAKLFCDGKAAVSAEFVLTSNQKLDHTAAA